MLTNISRSRIASLELSTVETLPTTLLSQLSHPENVFNDTQSQPWVRITVTLPLVVASDYEFLRNLLQQATDSTVVDFSPLIDKKKIDLASSTTYREVMAESYAQEVTQAKTTDTAAVARTHGVVLTRYCPCCSDTMLRHISPRGIYWFCRHCYQEMPDFSPLSPLLQAAFSFDLNPGIA